MEAIIEESLGIGDYLPNITVFEYQTNAVLSSEARINSMETIRMVACFGISYGI